MYRLKLTNCNRYALIDKEDKARVRRYGWYLLKVGYVGTHMKVNGKKTIVYLHRFVMRAEPGDPEIDHRFGNKLDNRKRKLRFATRRISNINSLYGKYRGVHYWNNGRGKCHWQAYIGNHRKRVFLGTFYVRTMLYVESRTSRLSLSLRGVYESRPHVSRMARISKQAAALNLKLFESNASPSAAERQEAAIAAFVPSAPQIMDVTACPKCGGKSQKTTYPYDHNGCSRYCVVCADAEGPYYFSPAETA